MKYFIIIYLLLIPFSLTLGQENNNCSEFTENKYDKVTGNSRLQAKSTIIVKNDSTKDAFEILMFKPDKLAIIILVKSTGGKYCIDKFSKINILFDDNSRLELYNSQDYNCDAISTIGLGNFGQKLLGVYDKWKALKELSTKKIQTIRIWTGNTYVQNDFSESNKTQFISTLNCLIDSKMRSKMNYTSNDDIY